MATTRRTNNTSRQSATDTPPSTPRQGSSAATAAINTDRDHLVSAFGERTVSALTGLIDDRILAIFGANREQLLQMHPTIVSMSQRYGNQPEVRQAAAAVAGAMTQNSADQVTAAHGGTDAAQLADQDTTRTEQAQVVVDQAGQSLAQRLGVVETMLKPRPNSERANRIQDIEADITGLRADVDRLETGQRDTQVVSAVALASASSAGVDYSKIGKWMFITFVVTLIVFMAIFTFTPLNWNGYVLIGIPAIAGGIVGALMLATTAARSGPPSEDVASASAIVSRWGQQANAESGSNPRAASDNASGANNAQATAGAQAR